MTTARIPSFCYCLIRVLNASTGKPFGYLLVPIFDRTANRIADVGMEMDADYAGIFNHGIVEFFGAFLPNC